MEIQFGNVVIANDAPGWTPELLDISIKNGIITSISHPADTTAPPSVCINGVHVTFGYQPAPGDLMISTGWVDVFADYREPGFEQKETIATGAAAAAAGGYTDVLLLPGTHPPISNRQSLAYIQQRAAGLTTRVHTMGAISQNLEGKELSEMMDMHAGGAVAFTDGWKPVQNANLMQKALEYVRAFDGLVVQMPVEASLSAGGLMNEGIISTQLGMAGVSPLAETLLLYRDLELARYTGSRIHITGITLAESVNMIAAAKNSGVNVSCSVTPYHLSLTDNSLLGYSSKYKVTPPLRTEADRLALIAGLHNGVIDCIASHHRPQDWDAKEKEFEYAADGMAVQEQAFSIVNDALSGALPAHQIATLFGARARKALGLHQPVIEVGAQASLTLFDANTSTSLNTHQQHSLSINNPFLGKYLKGKVLGIINNQQHQFNTIS